MNEADDEADEADELICDRVSVVRLCVCVRLPPPPPPHPHKKMTMLRYTYM
jgi:hypothetical protein